MRLALATLALAATLQAAPPQVAFSTSLGAFTVELDPQAEPATVANFLAYVKAGHYKGTTFHRVIGNFMIQGGGMTAEGLEKATRKPVKNEAKAAQAKGWRNVRGTVAMARTGDPHSATSQFFVNVVDNPALDAPSPDGWGYCAFGKVVQGMDTVDRIRAVPTGAFDAPRTPVVIKDARIVKR